MLYRLESIPEIELYYANVGAGMMSSGTSSATVTVNLVPADERSRSTDEVCEEIKELLSDMAGADITVASSNSAMGSMASADVTLNVYGYDSATLLSVEQDLIELLSNVNGITDVEGSTGETVPEAKVTVDRSKASLYGITTASIAGALNTAITGSTEIDVVLRYDTDELNYLTDLSNLTIPSAYGSQVSLSDVATITMGESATSIYRENQRNYITLNASAKDLSGSEAQKLVQNALAGYSFPEAVPMRFPA